MAKALKIQFSLLARRIWSGIFWALAGCGFILGGLATVWGQNLRGEGVTNLAQLRTVSLQPRLGPCPLCLEGDVWWVDGPGERLVLADASGAEMLLLSRPACLLKEGGRVRVQGRVEVRAEADGYRLGAPFGESGCRVALLGSSQPPACRPVYAGQLLNPGDNLWAEVEGTVRYLEVFKEGARFELHTGSGQMRVEVCATNDLPADLHNFCRVRLRGVCLSGANAEGQSVASLFLVPRGQPVLLEQPAGSAAYEAGAPDSGQLPLLNKTYAVRELAREEAVRGYPVDLTGVVTCVQPQRRAFTLQDSESAVYVIDDRIGPFELPALAERVRVEGTTRPGIVKARSLYRLGRGVLPVPERPAWDQVLNGSIDSRWVELQGLVENINYRSNGWTRINLRTREGILKVNLLRDEVHPAPLEEFEDSVVRLRGCLFADWNTSTLKVKVGQVRFYRVEIMAEEPAPNDLFAQPRKRVADLMRFDPNGDKFRRVKVCGQVVFARGHDYFLMDGPDGLRFIARHINSIKVGDLVEVVGFPDISSASPVLYSAVARRVGRAKLPEPVLVTSENLVRASLDATRVRLQAVFLNLRGFSTNQTMELQVGPWHVMARVSQNGEWLAKIRRGSRLELVGVYCAQGSYQSLGKDIAPVELLVASGYEVKVISAPPWWTLRRLLFLVGALGCVLAGMALWVWQLRRRVEERSAELARQIQTRERLEHQRAMEQERTRIAQDLHDELGSDITEIGMLAARARSLSGSEQERKRFLDMMGAKTRQSVDRLEEMVWAMNPMRDSFPSMVSYFGFYADRFLGLAAIKWRLETGPEAESAEVAVEARVRHQSFLIFKEALANVVHHAGATEVVLTLQVRQEKLRLEVTDNGRGLPAETPLEGMDGIANMKARARKMGGSLELVPGVNSGTMVRLLVPIKGKDNS